MFARKPPAIRSAEALSLLAAITEHEDEMAADIGRQLERIHTLVNSNLTASMRAELDATIREVAMMREVIALNEAAGREPSAEAIQAVEATDIRIAELRASIDDKLVATDLADSEP